MNDIFNDNVSLKTETPAFAKHVLPAVPTSEVYLEDCVTALKRYADNHFDLAIVDPPYGLGKRLVDGGSVSPFIKSQNKKVKEWDNAIPTDEYFEELKRVSKVLCEGGAFNH
jgi:DNA modification methylase